MENSNSTIAPKLDWLVLALFLVPLLVMVGTLPIFPSAAAFTNLFSVSALPKHLHQHVEYIIFVPLSALVVAFFRLTLGIRVLRLFRPILIAIAFRIIGIPIGPGISTRGAGRRRPLASYAENAPSYARVPVTLSLVAVLLLIPVIAPKWWQADWLKHLAYFPIIALCLTCKGFAKVLAKKGMPEAAWRTPTTVVVACIITGIANIPGAMPLFFRFPELLVMQVGLILVTSEYLNYGLFDGKNPFAAMPLAAAGSEQSIPVAPGIAPLSAGNTEFTDFTGRHLTEGGNVS